MKLEMRPSLSLRAEQRQNLKLEQAAKIEMVQRLNLEIKNVRGEIHESPEDMVGDVMRKVIGGAPEPINQAAEQLFGSGDQQHILLNDVTRLVQPTDSNLSAFAIDYLYKTQRDNNNCFTITDAENKNPPERTEISFDYFNRAMRKDKMFDDEYSILEQQVKAVGATSDVTATLAAMREMRNAKFVAQQLSEAGSNIAGLMRYLLNENVDGEPLLSNFLTDAYLLGKLDFLASERLLKRFSRHFADKPPKEIRDVREYDLTFLNSTGEFVLISMGIISPSIFTLQKAQVDDLSVNEICEEAKADRIDLRGILAKNGFSTRGTIFWNRYHTPDMKPTAITDEKIREFITRTVRKDADALLEAAGYRNFVSNLSDEYANFTTADRKDREAVKDFFFQNCADLFHNPDFLHKIAELIKTKWRNELVIFYQ